MEDIGRPAQHERLNLERSCQGRSGAIIADPFLPIVAHMGSLREGRGGEKSGALATFG